MSRRVVVTGIGLICGVGNTTPDVWKNLLAGKSGMAPISAFDTTDFPVTFAAEVKNFDPLKFIDKKESRKMGRFIHFALAASDFALEASGLKVTPQNEEAVGIYIGSGIGGFDVIEREHANLLSGGPKKISPFFIPATIINLASGQVSIRTGAKGPNSATATACTTSAHAVGDSFRLIQRGEADKDRSQRDRSEQGSDHRHRPQQLAAGEQEGDRQRRRRQHDSDPLAIRVRGHEPGT